MRRAQEAARSVEDLLLSSFRLAQLAFGLFFFPAAAGADAGYGLGHPGARLTALVLFVPLMFAAVGELAATRGLRRRQP